MELILSQHRNVKLTLSPLGKLELTLSQHGKVEFTLRQHGNVELTLSRHGNVVLVSQDGNVEVDWGQSIFFPGGFSTVVVQRFKSIIIF